LKWGGDPLVLCSVKNKMKLWEVISKVAKYFTEEECKCHCCGQLPAGGMNQRLFDVLDAIREDVGVPVTILSGYRCPIQNEVCKGVKNSQHLLGNAADITYNGIDVNCLAKVAEECSADGIGRYWSQGFVHVDVRGEDARWDEK